MTDNPIPLSLTIIMFFDSFVLYAGEACDCGRLSQAPLALPHGGRTRQRAAYRRVLRAIAKWRGERDRLALPMRIHTPS